MYAKVEIEIEQYPLTSVEWQHRCRDLFLHYSADVTFLVCRSVTILWAVLKINSNIDIEARASLI